MLKQHSHIVAPIPDELRTRALYTVGELRDRGKADKEAVEKLFSLIMDMTDEGLDFFFLEPLRRLDAQQHDDGHGQSGHRQYAQRQQDGRSQGPEETGRSQPGCHPRFH